MEDGGLASVSAIVDVDRLLDDDGSFGAENVLDTVDSTDSWESGGSGLCAVAMVGIWMVLRFSVGAIDK